MRFFFYGTLRPELAPPILRPVLDRGRSLGEGTVKGSIYAVADYPGLILDEIAAETVRGVVFEFPDDPEIEQTLDDYEGFRPTDQESSLFLRRMTKAVIEGGTEVDVWVYVYHQSTVWSERIEGGDFVRWLETRRSEA